MFGASTVRKAFDPRDISDCALWVRSDLDVRVSSSGAFVSMKDQIAGKLFVPVSGSVPTTGLGINNKPKIVFSTQAIYCSSFFLNGPMTIFNVCKLNATPTLGTSQVPWVVQGNASAALRALQIFINVAGYQNFTFKNDLSTNAVSVGYNPTLDTNLHSWILSYNGGSNIAAASYTTDDNGVVQTLTTSLAIGSATNFFTSLGAAVDDPGATLSAGSSTPMDWYEFGVWKRPLTARERLDLYAYAKNRYAGI